MGNILSGGKGRLIYRGGAWRAADSVISGLWRLHEEAVSFAKGGGHAR